MKLSKVKTLAIVFALLFVISFAAVGCRPKEKTHAWVNTSSMPGQTFATHSSAKRGNSAVVYLGTNDDSSNVNFGPKDVNFEFKSLR